METECNGMLPFLGIQLLDNSLGTRGFFSCATGSFVSSAAGRHVFGRSPKTRAAKPREKTFRAGHFLRLDRNRKPRLKSLWHPHYQSHVDNRYKQSLLRTMLYRAYRLSFCWLHFSDECNRLKTAFSHLKYAKHLVNSTIKSFVDSKVFDQQRPLSPAKRRKTRFEWFYHLKTKSQQIL